MADFQPDIKKRAFPLFKFQWMNSYSIKKGMAKRIQFGQNHGVGSQQKFHGHDFDLWDMCADYDMKTRKFENEGYKQ